MEGLRNNHGVTAKLVTVVSVVRESMVVGRAGVHGVLAVETAKLASKHVREAVQIHRLPAVEHLVLEHPDKLKHATHTIVQ